MTIIEILDSVQYVVDSQGQQTAVQLDLASWEALRGILEDLEDIAEIELARQEREETVPWETVLEEYALRHNVELDVQD